MQIRVYCWFTIHFLFLSHVKIACSHLTIEIAPSDGNDTTCLKHLPRTPCRTLKFVLQYILVASNESSVDIDFIEDGYDINELLKVHTQESRVLHLRLFSRLPRVTLTCTNNSQRIFDVFGPNLRLEFQNITFENCGHSNSSVVPAIAVNDTNKVSFHSCIFQDNWSGAFFALNSDVHIENSTFQRNFAQRVYNNHSFKSIMSAFSGGVGILFQNERRMMSINVFKTRFIQNRVRDDQSEYYVAQKLENAVISGGAMHVTFSNKSKCWTTINVAFCHFESNVATFGGGLLIELFGYTLHNKISISSTLFTNNSASQAGGAFLLSLWDFSAKTELTMADTILQENWSRSGSAMYVFLQSQFSAPQTREEILLFKRLRVVSNSGPAGSAVKIVSHLFGPRSMRQIPIFEDCIFLKNTNPPLNGYAYLAAFILDRINVVFNGTNMFIGNVQFGAAFFSNSYVKVYGKLHFVGNIGLQGGALSMQDSQIVLHPGSNLLFQDNYATFAGGAINVVTNVIYHVGVMKNPTCFLVYSEDKNPSEWNANITFLNNSAALRGSAICIDSLMMCAWDSSSRTLNFSQALRWKPTFHYEGNVLCTNPYHLQQCRKLLNDTSRHDISTFVSSLQERNGKRAIETCPGEEAVLDIVAKDELNNSVFTVIADKVANSDGTVVRWLNSKETFFAIQPHQENKVLFKYTYNPNIELPLNSTADVYYYDMFSIGRVFTHFTLRPQPCRPGFIQHKEACVCDDSNTGVMGCTQDGHYVQYKEGYWVGLVDGVFTILPCPFGYCSCTKHPYSNETASISGCFFDATDATNDLAVCANKRSGHLCGQCRENYTVGIQTFRCVPKRQREGCMWANVFSFIFTILICILILFFNPGLDNELRGPLFFFQVLPLFFPPVQYTTTGTINVYNLVFFLASIFGFTIPFFGYFFSKCYILEGQDNLDMLAWGYSSSVIALFVFLVAFILSYKGVILIRRKNAVQCFWVLLIFMYSSLMSTSLRIVDCPKIQGKLRLFVQGSIICHQGRHLYWTIVAFLILLCGIVIPILIIVFTKTNPLKISPYYLDTLTDNLNAGCLYWWSVDLLRRLLIVSIGVLVHIWKNKQIALIFATNFILSIHCYFQPYEESRANISEMIFLFVLSGLGVFQFLDIPDEKRDRANFVVVCIMLFYTLVLVIIKLVLFVQRRVMAPPENEDYESLDDNPSVSAPPTTAITDQSLEERREKLAFLFDRSESPRDEETRHLISSNFVS